MASARSARRRAERRQALRASLIALVSAVVVFGGLAWVIVNSAGWPRVQKSFLDGARFADALPDVIVAFGKNVQLFLVAEALVLCFGLVLAVMRSLPGPVFFPLRALATIYVDIFRALPGILVIYVFGFGIPGLRLPGVPNEPFFWAAIALTMIYSAYVSEVYRAGIDSIHPSQDAAARSLGLSRFQALRHVVVPQAVRRVIPPLLNDFIGLQKDTNIKQAATFSFTAYMAVALVFILVTIPLARLTDWLIARDRRQQSAGVRR